MNWVHFQLVMSFLFKAQHKEHDEAAICLLKQIFSEVIEK